MDNWFPYRPAGQYCAVEFGKGKANFYTFTPNPLLAEDFEIKLDVELVNLLSDTHRLLGQLQGMSEFLPNIAAVNSVMMKREAFASCRLDGIEVLFYDVLSTSQKTEKAIAPINNYISAILFGLEKIKENGYSNTLLCDINSKMGFKNTYIQKTDFRTEYVTVGKIKVFTNGLPMFNPTAPELIPYALRDLEQFIQGEDDIDILIKAALAYYQFETIQPFLLGNGQIGRILLYLILADKKILMNPLLSMSEYLYLNKMECIDRMNALRNKGNYTQWIKFFLRGILFSAADSLKKIRAWLHIREMDIRKIEESGKMIKTLRTFYDHMEYHPIFNIPTITQEMGIAYNTGVAAIKSFSGLGLVKQLDQKERYRCYVSIGFSECFLGNDIINRD